MRKIIIIILVLTFNLNSFIQSSINAQDNTLGAVFITNDVYDGLTLFAGGKRTFLIDNCGRVINEWTSEFRVAESVYLLQDGNLLRTGTENLFSYGNGGIIEIYNWSGNLLWQGKFNNDSFILHHDIAPLPNGNILAIGYSLKTREEAWNAGAKDSIEYLTTEIIEIKPIGSDSSEIVWKWELWDHLVQDIDSTRNNFGVKDQNPQLFDINSRLFQDFVSPALDLDSDLMHINSIDYNAITDEILLSSRDQYELYIIDHSTTTVEASTHTGGDKNKGGDFLYRFGPQNLYGQHDAHWIGNDTILFFNNGFRYNFESRRFSSADRVVPQRDTLNNYIYNQTIVYDEMLSSEDNATDFYSSIMGSAQLLKNGNIFICDSDSGIFYEFNSNGELVWEYANPLLVNGIAQQGNAVSQTPLIFRAKKISKSDTRFIGLDLTPQDPIELDFNIQECLDLTFVEDLTTIEESKVFPNPTFDEIEIKTNLNIVQIMIYDNTGSLVLKSKFKNHISLTNVTQGIYFLKLVDNFGNCSTQKIIKL